MPIPQVQNGIADDLPRAMVGYFTTPFHVIDLDSLSSEDLGRGKNVLATSPAAKGDYGVMLHENQDIREVRFDLGSHDFPLEIPRPPVFDEIDVDYISPSFEIRFLHGTHESIRNERVLVNLSDYIILIT